MVSQRSPPYVLSPLRSRTRGIRIIQYYYPHFPDDDYHPHYPDMEKDYFLRLSHLAVLLQLAVDEGIKYPRLDQLWALGRKYGKQLKATTIKMYGKKP